MSCGSWSWRRSSTVPSSPRRSQWASGRPSAPPRPAGVAPSPTQRVVERLADRAAVLVLDNCEHVVDDASVFVVELLRRCPNLRVLTTSRVPLDVEGEHQLPLGPLDSATASRLFVARAGAVQPLVTGAGDQGESIATLVSHLDRLPLAIELAAARTKTLPVAEIARRLDERFQLLRRTSRGAIARHDGLEAAIAWSYDLLFDEERRGVPPTLGLQRRGDGRGGRVAVRARRPGARQPPRRSITPRCRHDRRRGSFHHVGDAARLRARPSERGRRARRCP